MAAFVDRVRYDGVGYQPVVDFQHWRVAYLNYGIEYTAAEFKKAERHMQTDEVFLLLEGSAQLLIGGNDSAPGEPEWIEMEPFVAYNIRQAVWHQIFTDEAARVLIVENQDTTAENSEYHHYSAEDRDRILNDFYRWKADAEPRRD